MRFVPLLPVAALLVACRASAPDDEARLPFHVALAPVLVTDDLKWQHDDEAPAPEDRKFELEFPPEVVRALEEQLRESLEARSFVRVSALPPAATPSTSVAALVPAALARRADLLVACRLRYHPAVVFELDGMFALDVPVWVFLGPVSWLIDDCDYVASVQLTAEFYDLGEAAPRPGEAPSAPTRLLTVTPGFERTDLDYIDRNHGAVLRYVPSLIIPPGLLFRGTEEAREEVREHALDALVTGLADAVRQRSEDLVQERQRPRGGFYLDPASLALRPGEGGAHRLHCELVLRPSASIEELHELALEDEDGALLGEVALVDQLPRAEADGLRYVLDVEFVAPRDARRIVLVVSDQDRRRRSFTVELPAPAGARSAATRMASPAGRGPANRQEPVTAEGGT